jgi:hypothetical protein
MQEMGLCLYHRRNPKEERLMNEPNLMVKGPGSRF